MSKVVKSVVGLIVVVLVIAIAAGLFVFSNLNSLVKNAIESAGTEAAGVAVGVGSVDIALADARGTITGLEIGNPAGFASDYAVALGEATVQLDLNNISRELVTIQRIRVNNPVINFEQKGTGSNLQTILDNLQAGSGSDAGDSSDQPRLIVNRFEFLNASARVSIPALNQDRTVKIPDVVVTGIGKAGQGATAAEVGRQILEPIIRQTISAAANVKVDELKEKAREKADEKLDDLRDKAGDKVGEKLGGFLKRD